MEKHYTIKIEGEASPVWACRSAATMREAFAEARAKGYAVRRAPDCDAKEVIAEARETK